MIYLYPTRMLKTKDIEWYWLANREIDFDCDVLLIDTHRPSTINDFPEDKEWTEINYPEDVKRYDHPNFIKALVLTDKEIKDEKLRKEITDIVESLLSQLIEDNWNIQFITYRIDNKDEKNKSHREYQLDYVDNYLITNLGFTEKSLDRFKNPTFHFLTQEKTWTKEMEKKYKIKFET